MKSFSVISKWDESLKHNEKFVFGLLIVFWACLQIVFLLRRGVVTGLEATKYIHEAEVFLQTGRYSSGNFLFYSVQIQLIALCLKLHLNFIFIVILQMILNGLSAICFFRLLKTHTDRHCLPFLGTFYFLILFYYHEFNTFLFTESIFFSLSVIYTWFLFSITRLTAKNRILIVLFVVILYLTRPTGIFFIPATYFYLILKFYPVQARKIIIYSGIVVLSALFFLFNYSLGSGGNFDFMQPYLKGYVICDVPTSMRLLKAGIPVEQNSIQGLLYIALHYPDVFFSLALRRLGAFFGISRTYYSLSHNLFISSYFYLIYLVVILKLKTLFSHPPEIITFLIINLGLMTLTVMFSCDEWSNRFMLSEVPFLVLLGIFSLDRKTV